VDLLVFGLDLQVELVGELHEEVLGVALHLEAEAAEVEAFEVEQALDFEVEAVAAWGE
jgi:hypothetical protein